MRRREFIKIIAGSGVPWPLAAHGQQGERVRRIGVLMAQAAANTETTEEVGAFAQGLAELGWTIGRNVRIEISLCWRRSLHNSKIRDGIGRSHARRPTRLWHSEPGRPST